METPATITEGGHLSPNNSDRTTDEDNKNAIFDPAAEPTAAKRPRGRPPGSKNKPKPMALVAVDTNNTRRHVLEFAAGADVVTSLAAYARAHGCALEVLHAVGSVAGAVSFRNVRHPLNGQFDIFSLDGFVFPDNNPFPTVLTLAVSSGPMPVTRGVLDGPLIAASPVLLLADSFFAPPIEKVPFPPPISAPVENSTVRSDPALIEGPGSGFNPGFNNINLEMVNWRQEPLQQQPGWALHQQHNGRSYLNTNTHI